MNNSLQDQAYAFFAETAFGLMGLLIPENQAILYAEQEARKQFPEALVLAAKAKAETRIATCFG